MYCNNIKGMYSFQLYKGEYRANRIGADIQVAKIDKTRRFFLKNWHSFLSFNHQIIHACMHTYVHINILSFTSTHTFPIEWRHSLEWSTSGLQNRIVQQVFVCIYDDTNATYSYTCTLYKAISSSKSTTTIHRLEYSYCK